MTLQEIIDQLDQLQSQLVPHAAAARDSQHESDLYDCLDDAADYISYAIDELRDAVELRVTA